LRDVVGAVVAALQPTASHEARGSGLGPDLGPGPGLRFSGPSQEERLKG